MNCAQLDNATICTFSVGLLHIARLLFTSWFGSDSFPFPFRTLRASLPGEKHGRVNKIVPFFLNVSVLRLGDSVTQF